jgi:tryptophan synthase alpha chain
MSLIRETFERLENQGRKALIGYITAGYPTKASFRESLIRLQQAGLDMIEVGIPFSDPMADGPTIQRSSQIALENGVNLSWIMNELSKTKNLSAPIIFMTYANPVVNIGVDTFFRRARASGVSGVIIPDLIPEEGNPFEVAARRESIDLIYLAAPTTDSKRLKQIAAATQGFLYAVSLTGITGVRTTLPRHISTFLRRLRGVTDKPIALGFGISTPAQVRELRARVDGVIVGSALINALGQSLRHAVAFVRSLQHALNPSASKEKSHAA